MDEPEGEDVEELLRDLAALCDALRAFCRHGNSADLSLGDMESLATVAARVAERLVDRLVGDQASRAGCERER